MKTKRILVPLAEFVKVPLTVRTSEELPPARSKRRKPLEKVTPPSAVRLEIWFNPPGLRPPPAKTTPPEPMEFAARTPPARLVPPE